MVDGTVISGTREHTGQRSGRNRGRTGAKRVQAKPAALIAAQKAFQRGNTRLIDGRWPDALKAFADALTLWPEYPEVMNSMGRTLAEIGEHQRAVVCYAKALHLRPRYVKALSNMGYSLLAIGQTGEAVQSLMLAIEFEPHFADAYVHLSKALLLSRRYQDAIDASVRALQLQPDSLDPLLNTGCALMQQGRQAEAVTLFQQALDLRPTEPRFLNNLGQLLLEQGRVAEAIAAYQQALLLLPDYPIPYSNLLYAHAFTRNVSAAEELRVARGWELAMVPQEQREQARRLRTTPGAFSRTARSGRRLRLGIVSAELGTHAVAEFLEPLLAHLDPERFHLTLFPTVGRSGTRAQRLRGLADQVIPLVGTLDDIAAERIRDESIDVLMDTSGHTAGNRLGIFARRAAPVQCTYIGYWSTTGLTEMDWFLSDQDAPQDAEEGFSEGLWRLPRIAVCYHGDRSLRNDLWTPPQDGTLRLGCFNKLAKIREETLALWAGVLHALPHSRLVLEDQGSHPGEAQTRIRSTLATHGIAPERTSFIPYELGHERHMLLYNGIDIALDTIPFNSGTTAFDALWMSVPLVTIEGTWIGGRMGGSILRSLGRREWIAADPNEFISIVARLGADTERLQAIRRSLREEMAVSVLCHGAGLSAALADAFEGMYDRWWAGQTDAHGEPARPHESSPNKRGGASCGSLREATLT